MHKELNVSELWPFLMALAVVFLLPGPDMILLLQTGARHGKGSALATAIGLGVARACHVALAALGLAALFKAAPWTFDVVRYAGAAYLLWIGIQCLRTTLLPPAESAASNPGPTQWRAAIQRGLLTNLLNPKALLFCSVLLPQFIEPHAGSVLGQFAILGVALVVVGLVFDSTYAFAGVALGRWLQRNPGAQRLQQWLFGSLLIGFAMRLTFVQQA
ncbi:LysE family translocator [Pseudomonas sp. PB3P13]